MKTASESFSAFLDGEASELDVQRMLKALEDQPGLMDEWRDLSQTQAVMQNEVIVDTAPLHHEVPTHSSVESTWSQLKQRVLQGSIAAAAALVVVVGVNQYSVDTDAPLVSNGQDAATDVLVAEQQFEMQRRLDQYLREHAEQASFTSGHVVSPSDLEWERAEIE